MSSLRSEMRMLTLQALKSGIHHSDVIREFIANDLGLPITSAFTNTHAWALVDLQSSGEIIKRGRREYALATGRVEAASNPFPAPTESSFPSWACEQVARANRKNGPDGPRFTRSDLIELWKSCEGKCAVTKLPFSLEPIGSSLVRRVYKPSVDRIKAGEPYTRENCRLVMTAVNFAMNAWGEDVYLRLARAAVEAQPR